MVSTGLIAAGVIGIGVGISVAIGLSIQILNAIIYSYTNARARALTSNLLQPNIINSYCDLGFLEIITNVESGNYQDIILMIEKDYSVENLEYALNRKSHKMNKKLLMIVPKKDQPFFRHLTAQFDYQNIKTLVRLKNAGKLGMEYKNLLVPTPNFRRSQFEELLTCSIEDLKIKLRFTAYKQLMDQNLILGEEFVISEFERKMNISYYQKLLYFARKANSKSLKKYSRVMIDYHNIKGLTSISIQNLEKNNIVTGGFLNNKKLLELKASKTENLQSITSQLYLNEFVNQEDIEVNSLMNLRVAFEKYIKKLGSDLLLRDPMSINSTLGYYIKKEAEILNLNRILKMKFENINSEKIKEMIIWIYV